MTDERPKNSETNYSPQFAVANTPPPGAAPTAPAGTKPPTTKATAGAAGPPPGTTSHVLPSAVIAAYYSPAVYVNSNRSICESDDAASSTSAAFPCASSVTPSLGHYVNSAAGVGGMDKVVGAVVMGIGFAVVLVV